MAPLLALNLGLASAWTADPPTGGDPQDRQDREADRQHFRQLFTAIQAYRKDHTNEYPNWLSDLVPQYLSDTNALICPVEARTGQHNVSGMEDPKVRTSYIYEFNPTAATFLGDELSGQYTMRKWKLKQMEYYGEVVPLVRCWLHDPVVNLAVCGELFETSTGWEGDPRTGELMKKIGATPYQSSWRTLVLTVVDAESREPVAGAEVQVNLATALGSLPAQRWTTDAKGQCTVRAPQENVRYVALTVNKAGYVAGSFGQQEEEAKLASLGTMSLQKGIAIEGWVRGPAGQPVSGASVQLMRNQERERAPAKTDAQGKWSLDGFPREFGVLSFEVSHPDYRTATVDTAEPKLTTTLLPRVRITGSVVDGASRKPVANFRVVPGYDYYRTVRWAQKEAVAGQDGRFTLQPEDVAPRLLRVLAEGYQAQVSTWLKEDLAEPKLEFVLKPAVRFKGQVVLPDGQPAAEASVTQVLEASEPRLAGLALTNDAPVLKTDAQGQFAFELDPLALAVAAVHEKGMALVPMSALNRSQRVSLQAWSRVEVQLPTVGPRNPNTWAGLTADLNLPGIAQCPYVGTIALDFDTYGYGSVPGGRVAVGLVPPGQRFFWRPVALDEQWGPYGDNVLYNGVEVAAPAGQTNRTDFPAQSANLLGKLVANRSLDWGSYLGRLTVRSQAAPQPRDFFFTLHANGRFRVQGLPLGAGEVELAVYKPPILVGLGKVSPQVKDQFVNTSPATEAIPIEVEFLAPAGASELPLMDFEVHTLDGKPLKASKFRGKYLLVDFWTTWSGAGLGSFPCLEVLAQKPPKKGKLVLLSVNLDRDPETAKAYLAWKKPRWQQALGGDWVRSPLLGRYGGASLPAAFLVGPDGKVLAKDLAGPEIAAAVEKNLP